MLDSKTEYVDDPGRISWPLKDMKGCHQVQSLLSVFVAAQGEYEY
jgi:hypothetical protein